MKLLMFRENEQNYVGIKTASGIMKTTVLTDEFLAAGLDALERLHVLLDASSGEMFDEAQLEIAPVVPNPGKILCVGLNYRKHAIESGMAIPEEPILFSKFNNTIAAHNTSVPVKAEWDQIDYEAELVVIIGKQAKDVSEAEALAYVLGYSNGNDLSERNLQMRTGQWLLGKTLDKFFPIGPYLVTADDIKDPQNLRIRGWLNGELRQDSSTGDMIFSVAQVIAHASRYMTLEPGDVISTGTPEGVILGYPPAERQWMKAGDEYRIEIEGMGQLSNRLAGATS